MIGRVCCCWQPRLEGFHMQEGQTNNKGSKGIKRCVVKNECETFPPPPRWAGGKWLLFGPGRQASVKCKEVGQDVLRSRKQPRHFPACFAAFSEQWVSWLPEPVQPAEGGPVQNVSRSNVRTQDDRPRYGRRTFYPPPQLPAAAANCTHPDTIIDIMSYESLTPSPTCTGARASPRASRCAGVLRRSLSFPPNMTLIQLTTNQFQKLVTFRFDLPARQTRTMIRIKLLVMR